MDLPTCHKRAAAALTLLTLAIASQGTAQSSPLRGLDGYITRSMRDWGVVGLSIAIVKRDSTVYARGFGLLDIGKSAPVTPSTIFAIGSNTKLFTAVLAGMLVDSSRMAWDDPVTKYLPTFVLYDPYVTREITIRDLLSHRSGLAAYGGDLLWYGSTYTRSEILQRTRYLMPASSFRSTFAYQNLMFLAAGEAIAAAAGSTWEELIKQRVFDPLGMTRSSTSIRLLSAEEDVASPHEVDHDVGVPVPWRNMDNIAPAGAINSTAIDMARWLRLLLQNGRWGTLQLLDSATFAEISYPQTIRRGLPDSLAPSTHFSAYGLGVGLRDYRGFKILAHTGAIDGMASVVRLIPELELGIVVLTNTSGRNDLLNALAWYITDLYIGPPRLDWSTRLLNVRRADSAKSALAVARVDSLRVPGAPPSLPLKSYSGVYESTVYGSATVVEDGGHLVLRLNPALLGDLEHWHFDTFRARWRGLGQDNAFITFVVGANGKVGRFSTDLDETTEFLRVANDSSRH